MAELDTADQLAKLAEPEFKAKLISEESVFPESDVQLLAELMANAFTLQYELGDGFNYEPSEEQSIAYLADQAGSLFWWLFLGPLILIPMVIFLT